MFKHHDFLKLWSAQTVSQLGTQVTSFALPTVAILWLHASALQVGALATVQLFPFALIGLPAGVWVDRLPRRPILIAGDLGRALLQLTIRVAWLFGGLTLGQLYLVAFGTGILTVFFDIAWAAYLPALVDRSQLLEGNSRMELTRSGAQMTGPIVAGTDPSHPGSRGDRRGHLLMFVLMASVGSRAVPFLVVGGVIGSFGSVAYASTR